MTDPVRYVVETTYRDGSMATSTHDDYAEAAMTFEQDEGPHIASARLLEIVTTELARSKGKPNERHA